eukprot:4980718-Prorocentrum_lima.AAC.1
MPNIPQSKRRSGSALAFVQLLKDAHPEALSPAAVELGGRLFKINREHGGVRPSHGADGGLVADGLQFRAGQAGREVGDLSEVDGRGQIKLAA